MYSCLSNILVFILIIKRPSNNIEQTLKPIDSLGFMVNTIHIFN